MDPLQMPVQEVATLPNVQQVVESPGTSLQVSQDVKAEKLQLKAVLQEARNTRDVLVGFRSAVESGSYAGARMLALAQGMAFLEAILKQNNAHIHNIQERLDA